MSKTNDELPTKEEILKVANEAADETYDDIMRDVKSCDDPEKLIQMQKASTIYLNQFANRLLSRVKQEG